MAKLSVEELRNRRKAALGKNGDGAPKPAPFSGRAPVAEEPVVDDQATTNEIPLKVAPASPAVRLRSPDDTKTTLEMDLNQQKDLAAKSASDIPPEPEVLPVVLPPAPRVAAVVRRAAPAKEAIPDPEEKPAVEAKPPEKRDIVKEVVEMLKPHIAKLLGEKIGEAETRLDGKIDSVSGRVEELHGGMADISSNVEAIVMELDGSEEHDDDAVDVGEDGKVTDRRPSLRKALRELSGKADELKGRVDDSESNVANIVTELMGTDGNDGHIVEEVDGKPQSRPSVWTAISDLKGENEHASSALRGLLGKNYGRLHAIVVSHEIQTRKVLVKALRDKDYLEKVKQVAVEQDPETSRRILEAFADTDLVRLSLAQEQKSSIEKLDDPKLLEDKNVRALHDWVNKVTPQVVERAKECLDQINWEECEEANRSMIFGGDE